MNRRLLALLVLSTVIATIIAAQAGGLTVTVTYKGKGKVDATNKVWVFLLDHPNPHAGSQPLGTQMLTRNGANVTFSGINAETVYIALVYDQTGTYDGNTGPPPAGSPFAVHSKAGSPVAVKIGKVGKVTATFDDSRRFGQPPPKR